RAMIGHWLGLTIPPSGSRSWCTAPVPTGRLLSHPGFETVGHAQRLGLQSVGQPPRAPQSLVDVDDDWPLAGDNEIEFPVVDSETRADFAKLLRHLAWLVAHRRVALDDRITTDPSRATLLGAAEGPEPRRVSIVAFAF